VADRGAPAGPRIRREEAGEPRVVVLDDVDAVADAAARIVVDALREAIAARGRAHLALTGGSMAVPLYRELAMPPLRDEVDWSRVHLWWGDDRYVPTDHPESNAGLAYAVLLHTEARTGESGEGASSTDVLSGEAPGLAIPAHQVHHFEIEEAIGAARPARWAAERYERLLRTELPSGQGGLPVFDLILLGVGPDGHVLSVFPDSPALADDAPLVLDVPAPTHVEPHLPRLTLNPRLLDVARRVVVMAAGPAKAEMLGHVFGDSFDPARWPAQLALRSNATWLLDRAAAAELPAD
jgi:6-phosphogluconolactonase